MWHIGHLVYKNFIIIIIIIIIVDLKFYLSSE